MNVVTGCVAVKKVEFLAMTSFLTSSISKMDDQYVVLLEKVIVENIRLREVIETRDSDQRNMIQELTSKMASSSNSGTERASREKKHGRSQSRNNAG